jgi:hypothetical protein
VVDELSTIAASDVVVFATPSGALVVVDRIERCLAAQR